MSELLQELVGQKVVINPVQSGFYDGTVLSIGCQWLYLQTARKDSSASLISLNAISDIVPQGMMQAQSAAGELAPALIGRAVFVDSSLEYSAKQTGILEAFDEQWLRVRVKNKQYYISTRHIKELRLL